MIGFCLLSIVYSVISYLKQKKAMKENFSIPTQFFSVVLLVITATVSYASFSGEGTPYLFPRLLSIILIVTTIVDLVANLKKGKQTKQISLVAVKQFLPGFILILLYVFLAEVVGFYLSSLLFLLFIIFAYRKPWQKKADTNRIKQAIFDILSRRLRGSHFLFFL